MHATLTDEREVLYKCAPAQVRKMLPVFAFQGKSAQRRAEALEHLNAEYDGKPIAVNRGKSLAMAPVVGSKQPHSRIS